MWITASCTYRQHPIKNPFTSSPNLSSYIQMLFQRIRHIKYFMYLTFLGLEVGPASGLKHLVIVEVHTHLSKTLCFPYKSQFNVSVHRNKDVSFIQSFIHSSVLPYEQSVCLTSSGDLHNGHTSLPLSEPETSDVPSTWPCLYPPSSCICSKTEFSYSS
jgi:hypothetical protein